MPYTTELELIDTSHPDYNPNFKCRNCGERNAILFRKWESSDGGHEGTKYECSVCGYEWWAEGIDS